MIWGKHLLWEVRLPTGAEANNNSLQLVYDPSKFAHRGLRLNVGIMHTGSMFVVLRDLFCLGLQPTLPLDHQSQPARKPAGRNRSGSGVCPLQ